MDGMVLTASSIFGAKKNMKIDVIIPVYQPDEKLKDLLVMLKKQTFPVEHVLLMNTGEVTFPDEYLQLHPGIQVYRIKKEAFDHGGTRHKGAGYSDAEYLLYMTQDAVPGDERLVERLAASFSDKRVKAAYARQLPVSDCSELERYTRSFNYPGESRVKTLEDLKELGIKTFFCSNVCAMYEKKTYEELGGFVRHTIFNEDMIYAGGLIRNNYAIAYVAEALVYHSHNLSGLEQFHRNFDLAVSQADHPEIFAAVRSEKEGIRLVKDSALHFIKTGRPWLVAELVWKSGWKLLGYRMGKIYKKLQKTLIRICTMNPAYWGF